MEIEVKYKIPNEEIADMIWDNELFPGMEEESSREELDLHGRYYDTADMDLAKSRIAYRIRREGEHNIATIKWQGKSEDGLHSREELSCPVLDEKPDLKMFCESDIGEEIGNLVSDKELKIIMETKIWRRRYRIDTGEAILEVSVDSGKVETEKGDEDILEVEIELFTGQTDELLRIAGKLQKQYDLVSEDVSKYAKGLELLGIGGNCR